jgi:hypothetical protein
MAESILSNIAAVRHGRSVAYERESTPARVCLPKRPGRPTLVRKTSRTRPMLRGASYQILKEAPPLASAPTTFAHGVMTTLTGRQ